MMLLGTHVKPREGDIIETADDSLFDVKGFVHPPKLAVSFIRYFPSDRGTREREAKTYEKVYPLSERFDWLKHNRPDYLVHDPVFDETLCEVPFSEIKTLHNPVKKLQRLRFSNSLDFLEQLTVRFAELVRQRANIAWNDIGVSGSVLVGLHTPYSDIDIVVYGSHNCRKVHSALQHMLKDEVSHLRPYNSEELRVLFEFRSKDTAMSFSDFLIVESRKTLQGKFRNTDYFIRFVKNWNDVDEKYGDVMYKNCGYAEISSVVVDDSESIFTPCSYSIANREIIEGPELPIEEIASFRGRFCDQARNGETVVARGKVEKVTDRRQEREHYRLLVGNKPSDFIIYKH